MQLLPYELLQLVSSSLLPKYQCRLALVSKYNYKYLYNDLLRWHARKSLITPPRYKHYHVSLIEFNEQIVLYKQTYEYGLHVYNLTHRYMIPIDFNREHSSIVNNPDAIDIEQMIKLYACLEHTNILTSCYKYIHKTPLLVYLSSRHPLLSLPIEILDNIMGMLSSDDQETFMESSAYLNYIYN